MFKNYERILYVHSDNKTQDATYEFKSSKLTKSFKKFKIDTTVLGLLKKQDPIVLEIYRLLTCINIDGHQYKITHDPELIMSIIYTEFTKLNKNIKSKNPNPLIKMAGNQLMNIYPNGHEFLNSQIVSESSEESFDDFKQFNINDLSLSEQINYETRVGDRPGCYGRVYMIHEIFNPLYDVYDPLKWHIIKFGATRHHTIISRLRACHTGASRALIQHPDFTPIKCRDMFAVENAIHRLLKEYRCQKDKPRHEWFCIPTEMIQTIKDEITKIK